MIKKLVSILAVLSLLSCTNSGDNDLILGVWEQELIEEEPEIEVLGVEVINASTGVIEEMAVEEFEEKHPTPQPIIEGKHWVIKKDSIGMFIHGNGIYQKYKLIDDKIIFTGDTGGFYNYKIIDSNKIEIIGKERMILKRVDVDPSIFFIDPKLVKDNEDNSK